MTDDHQPGDDEQQPHVHGFTVVPAGLEDLLGAHREHRKHHQLREHEIRARLANFIDGLTVEQLVALRFMLNMVSGGENRLAEFLDGQLYSILRVVHGVDPETGETLEEQLAGKADGPSE